MKRFKLTEQGETILKMMIRDGTSYEQAHTIYVTEAGARYGLSELFNRWEAPQ